MGKNKEASFKDASMKQYIYYLDITPMSYYLHAPNVMFIPNVICEFKLFTGMN